METIKLIIDIMVISGLLLVLASNYIQDRKYKNYEKLHRARYAIYQMQNKNLHRTYLPALKIIEKYFSDTGQYEQAERAKKIINDIISETINNE